MLYIQNKLEDSSSYQTGYEIGKFIGHNPIISSILGILFVATLIYLLVKVVKKLKKFGEE